jgi:hypothetical protein
MPCLKPADDKHILFLKMIHLYTCTETCRRYVLNIISAINTVYLVDAISGVHQSKQNLQTGHIQQSGFIYWFSFFDHWRSAPCMGDSVVVNAYNRTPPYVSYQFAPSVNRATFVFDYLPVPHSVYLILCNRTRMPVRTVPYSWYLIFSRESVQLLYTVL